MEGSAWTVLSDGEDVAKKISANLGADAIYFGFGDASGWMIYHLF
jgi:hypothetical protein